MSSAAAAVCHQIPNITANSVGSSGTSVASLRCDRPWSAMMKRTLVGMLLVLSLACAVATRTPKYNVRVTYDKGTDFSRLKTYVWEPGWMSYDRPIDAQVADAVGRELSALGFIKGTREAHDVTVTYGTLRRTDVNLKGKAHDYGGLLPTYPVGTLVVLIRDSRTQRELFRGRSDTPLDLQPDRLDAIIQNQVTQIFQKYPTRRGHS
jgi:hypothetical protein